MDLEKFFDEKDLPYVLWEIEHEGQLHIIDNNTVIEAIFASQGEERKKISGTLFVLDFRNASINDYLKHLAECMIRQSFKQE